jgi:tetratricopeptide (TPR) repeat protein
MTPFIPAVLAISLFMGPAAESAVSISVSVFPAASPAGAPASSPTKSDDSQLIEQAYAYNKAGMIDMSKAQFDEAIEQFQHAAELVPDYGITRRDLRYTPNFMIGWAHEKQGRVEEACRAFRRFLDLAPAPLIEQGKADHATQYFDQHCPALRRPRQPPQLPDSDAGHGL